MNEKNERKKEKKKDTKSNSIFSVLKNHEKYQSTTKFCAYYEPESDSYKKIPKQT